MRACRDLIAMVKEYKHFQDGSIWDQVVKAAEKEIGEAGVSSECNTGLCESASSKQTVQNAGVIDISYKNDRNDPFMRGDKDWKCSRCNYDKVKYSNHYCASCGSPINWVE